MNHGIRSKSRTHPMLTTLLILVSAIGVVRPVSTQPPSGQASPRSTLPRPASLNRVKPLTEGEKLVYNVSWSNIPAAARLELETGAKGLYHGRESHLIQTRVLTLNEGWSVFGEIDNQYSSYIDPRSYLPHRLVSSLRQGRVNAQQQELLVSIDQAQATATFSATLGATMGDGIRMAIPSSTFDFSSLLLALRTADLTNVGRTRYNVLFDHQLLEIDIELVERRQLSIQSGAFNAICLRLSPRGQGRYRTILWMSDDAERTPLLIRAGTSLGEVRAELTGATVVARSKSGPVGLAASGPANFVPPFDVGERLAYNISWGNFINVGRASFEVRQMGTLNSQNVLELFGEASSSGPIRSLITVNEQITSFVLADRLIPVRTDLRLREGKRNKSDTALFNHAERTATLNNGTVVPIQPGTLDLIALFYNIRAAEVKPGETRQFNLLDANNRPRTISVRGLLLERIASPTGPRNSTRIEVLSAQNEVIAIGWISADRQRLPLQFSARTRFGEIKFRLVSTTTN